MTALFVRAFIEAALLGSLLILFVKSNLFSFIRSSAPRLAGFVLSFLIVWTVVQNVDRWQYEYPSNLSFIPLARFAMYQDFEPSRGSYVYSWWAIRGEQATLLNPFDYFGPVKSPSLNSRFASLGAALENGAGSFPNEEPTLQLKGLWGGGPSRYEAVQELEGWARAIWTRGELESFDFLVFSRIEIKEQAYSALTDPPPSYGGIGKVLVRCTVSTTEAHCD